MLTNTHIFTQKIYFFYFVTKCGNNFLENFRTIQIISFQIPSRRAYKNRGVKRNCLPVVPFLEQKAYVHRQIVIHWLPEPLYKLSVDLEKRRGDSRQLCLLAVLLCAQCMASFINKTLTWFHLTSTWRVRFRWWGRCAVNVIHKGAVSRQTLDCSPHNATATAYRTVLRREKHTLNKNLSLLILLSVFF